MIYPILSNSHKRRTLIEMLGQVDRRRNYNLILCSCYFNAEVATSVIRMLSRNINLKNIKIIIDKKEALKHGMDYLKGFISEDDTLKDLDITFKITNTDKLFHAKTYVLYCCDGGGEIVEGSLVVGSANLTMRGLRYGNSNIESLIATKDIDSINSIISAVEDLDVIDLDELYNFTGDKDELNLKYAIINEGYFFHRWHDNLEQLLAIKFKLSKYAMEQNKNTALIDAGFKMESATISKKYFKFDDFVPSHLHDAKYLIKKYGIETHLGYWIPKVVSNMVLTEELEIFKETLFNKIFEEMYSIEKKIKSDYNFLIKLNLIEPIRDEKGDGAESVVSEFSKKVWELKANDNKIKRLFTRYEIFELPYEFTNEEAIADLFDEMLEVAESKRKKNKSVHAFLESFNHCQVEPIKSLIFEKNDLVE